MPSAASYVAQAAVYLAVAAIIGVFSTRPVYHQVPPDMAQIKLALSHSGSRIEECRRLTSEELEKLPSNQRRPTNCSRGRLPIAVRLTVDNQPIYDAVLEPTGLSSDGPAQAYQKLLVPAGRHEIVAELRDSKRSEGFDYRQSYIADLKPWQNLAIEFQAEQGGFLFR